MNTFVYREKDYCDFCKVTTHFGNILKTQKPQEAQLILISQCFRLWLPGCYNLKGIWRRFPCHSSYHMKFTMQHPNITFTIKRKNKRFKRRLYLGKAWVYKPFELRGYIDPNDPDRVFIGQIDQVWGEILQKRRIVMKKNHPNYITQIEVWLYADKHISDPDAKLKLIGTANSTRVHYQKLLFNIENNEIIDLYNGANIPIDVDNKETTLYRVAELLSQKED